MCAHAAGDIAEFFEQIEKKKPRPRLVVCLQGYGSYPFKVTYPEFDSLETEHIGDPRRAVLVKWVQIAGDRSTTDQKKDPTLGQPATHNDAQPIAPAPFNASLAEKAALLLLGFWHGEFGTYLVYWRDEFEVSGIPKEESQSFFKSRMDESWSKLEESMGKLKLSVTRNAVEEDRTNPIIVMEDKQKRLYRAVARRFGAEKANVFLYGDLLGGELLWCENLSRGVGEDSFAKLWEMKLNQVTKFGPMLNLPEEDELFESLRNLVHEGGDNRTLLDDEQACRERIAGRCEEIVLGT